MPQTDVRDVIAAGLTSAEREWSARVGAGHVQPGEYLSDRERADVVLRELAERGYSVVSASAARDSGVDGDADA